MMIRNRIKKDLVVKKRLLVTKVWYKRVRYRLSEVLGGPVEIAPFAIEIKPGNTKPRESYRAVLFRNERRSHCEMLIMERDIKNDYA